MELELTSVPNETQKELESFPNVVGVGVGPKQRDGERDKETEAVIIFVEKKIEKSELADDEVIPEEVEIEGKTYVTDVQESGEIRALDLELTAPEVPMDLEAEEGEEILEVPPSLSRAARWRPAPAGVSVGHPDISAGTLGTSPLRLGTEDGRLLFLTNAHVAAPRGASEGDPVLQPGPYDGGSAPDDVIGRLTDEFSVINVSNSSPYPENRTDSALVEVEPDHLETDILELHEDLREFTDAEVGEIHTKSGRTTSVTSAECIARHVNVNVNYGYGIAKFVDMDVFDAMSAGGDSGSLIGLDREDGFFGTSLLFAGSSNVTIGIPMNNVQDVHGGLTPLTSQDLVEPNDLRITGTAFQLSLNAEQTSHRWSGPWADRYIVDFEGHPVQNGGWVECDVHSTYRTSNGIYYLIRTHNRRSSSVDCNVKYVVTR